MIYHAPYSEETGEYEEDKATAEHSFTSNQDGTYESKDGAAATMPFATFEEAVGEYMTPPTGNPPSYLPYFICYENGCDAP